VLSGEEEVAPYQRETTAHGVLRTIALTDPRHGAPLWLLIRPASRFPQRDELTELGKRAGKRLAAYFGKLCPHRRIAESA